MFRDLLESRHTGRRRTRVTAASVAAHAVAITLASAGTGWHPHAPPPEPVVTLVYRAPPAPLPPLRPSVHLDGGPSSAPGRDTRPTAAPRDTWTPPTVGVSPVEPALGARPAGASLASADGAAPAGDAGAAAAPAPGADGAYRTVERAAVPLPGAPRARYPEALRDAGIEGDALLRFVVDTTGRVEPGSVVTVRASHDAFADAARGALLATRFAAAEVGGRRVRQLVEQSFAFTLRR